MGKESQGFQDRSPDSKGWHSITNFIGEKAGEPDPSDRGPMPGEGLTDEELFKEFAVYPEEAQALMKKLGYESRAMWEMFDEDSETIPMGSHYLRMIAHVACASGPVLLEKLDPEKYVYGGGGAGDRETRELSKKLKDDFLKTSESDTTVTD